MRFAELTRILRALEEAGARYLVAGGVAVNAHGYQRLTRDLDLVLELEQANVQRALDALAGLGYRPTLPVPPSAFADPAIRERWHRERNMEVFSLIPEDPAGITVDLFVTEPFRFTDEYPKALRAELSPGLTVPFVSVGTLIRMKQAAGRPRDLDDIQHLRWAQEEGDSPND